MRRKGRSRFRRDQGTKRREVLVREESVETRPVVKLWLETEKGYVFGEGTFELLHRIDKFGTISKAATSMNMSYRQAWGILKKVEDRLGEPLVETRRGGAQGGGKSVLTSLGRSILHQYGIEKQIVEGIQKDEWGLKSLPKELKARNKFDAEVISVESGDIASIVKIRIRSPILLTAVIAKEIAEELDLKEGATVQAIMKATSVKIGRTEE